MTLVKSYCSYSSSPLRRSPKNELLLLRNPDVNSTTVGAASELNSTSHAAADVMGVVCLLGIIRCIRQNLYTNRPLYLALRSCSSAAYGGKARRSGYICRAKEAQHPREGCCGCSRCGGFSGSVYIMGLPPVELGLICCAWSKYF
jgi:hypothetical protein